MEHPISQNLSFPPSRKTSKYVKYTILFASLVLALFSSSVILLVGYEILRPFNPSFTVSKTTLLATGFNRTEVCLIYFSLLGWYKDKKWGKIPLSALPIVVLGGTAVGFIAGFKSNSGPGVNAGTGALGASVVGFVVLSAWTALQYAREHMGMKRDASHSS